MPGNFLSEKYFSKLVANIQLNYFMNIFYRGKTNYLSFF